jgi:hypothetical protein
MRHHKKFAANVAALDQQAEDTACACRLHWSDRKCLAKQSPACQGFASELYSIACLQKCVLVRDFLKTLDDGLYSMLSIPLSEVLGVLKSYQWWIKGEHVPANEDMEGLIDDVLYCSACAGDLLERAHSLEGVMACKHACCGIPRGTFDLTTIRVAESHAQSLLHDTECLWGLCRKVFKELQASYNLPIK